MWFSVAFINNGHLVRVRVNHTQLFNKFDFGNYIMKVIEFTRKAGIGDDIQVNDCVVTRVL